MLLPITAPESPVWHILIEIYIAQAEAKPVSITDVGLLVNMPQSTTLRFLAILTDHHLVERTADPCDRRRIWVTLRNSGIAAVEAMLGHLDIEMAYARTI
jgi:DNA-binding MarR family transcriptional regulator